MLPAFWSLAVAVSGFVDTTEFESPWLSPSKAGVALSKVQDPERVWRVASTDGAEYTLLSSSRQDAKSGSTFRVGLRLRVDVNTKAMPELACFDASGTLIKGRSSLQNAPESFTTNWLHHRRLFSALPGTATVGLLVRCHGKGGILLSDPEITSEHVSTYETGALIDPLYASKRNGVVLESNFGVLNRTLVSREDRDGDGLWALVTQDLDEVTRPAERGEDWRSRFEHNPNAVFWSDGAVLKSDTVAEDRPPAFSTALRYRAEVLPGPYKVLVSDPGRACALSTDGKSWTRHEGGQEIDLGTVPLDDGRLDLWIDPCYRDLISIGPVYFDYVRLIPARDRKARARLFAAAVRKPGEPPKGKVGPFRVEITVQGPSFEEGGAWPVRCGLPVPVGDLGSPELVALEDGSGKRLPCQVRASAYWPDGSVKWLFIDFFHDFSRAGEGRYRVVFGSEVRSEPPPSSVQIRKIEGGLEVDTGAVRFVVPKHRFAIVDDIRGADGLPRMVGPLSVLVTESNGRVWSSADLPVGRLLVEQAGPLHAVILVESRWPESGRPSSGFSHRARIHAYAGSPLIQVDHFVANTDDRPARNVEGSMSSKVGARSVTIPVRLPGGARGVLTESGESKVPGQVDFSSEASALGQKEPRNARPGGWLSARSERGAFSFGIENFQELFPKALRWTPDGIAVDLWAAEGGEFSWIEGVGKTHHFSLFFGEKAAPSALLAVGRILAAATPEWYSASGAFGRIVSASESPSPEVERTLAAHIAEPIVAKVGLGFENHGDHSSGGYVKGSFLWDNNEYDVPAACFVHFARTGDRDALKVGLAGAEHYVDVDTVHYSRREPDWFRAQHVHSHDRFGHHTAQGPNMNHAGYVQGLILASCLTGDPDGLEGAKGIGDWVLRNLSVHTRGMERQLGHPLMTLVDLYEATWEDPWLAGAVDLVDQALRWDHPVRGGFLAPITESPAYYSGSPFCGGLVSASLLKFNGWANLPEIDRLLTRNATWTLTDVWEAPSGIQGKGGSPRRKGDPQNIASHLRMMGALYERTGDPLYLALPRQSILDGFGEGARAIGTRSTGLVFNYLPWFLKTMVDAGNPTVDPEFTVSPMDGPLTQGRGERFSARFLLQNRGNSEVEIVSATCRGRLDFERISAGEPVTVLAPGESREVFWTFQAPRDLNLSGQMNRRSYFHFAALLKREGRPFLALGVIEVNIRESPRGTEGGAP